jgi:hydroxysqualene dehydroxylase
VEVRVSGRLHVVGGGVAGLAAALAAARAGRRVVLHEASAQFGGRCRAVDGHDNGTHVLLGANRAALAFIEAVGARAGWIEPEPDCLPVVDLARGTVRALALSPWRWSDPDQRPPGLGWQALLDIGRLLHSTADRPVADMVRPGPFLAAMVEPLTLAALNTPVREASSRKLGRVLRRLALPGSARLFVAERGLGPDLVEPALATLRKLGVTLHRGSRLTGLGIDGRRVWRLDVRGAGIPLERADSVVLALPPGELARLLPGLQVPTRHEPIVNLHLTTPYAGRTRFVGLVGGLAQWMLVRPGRISLTVSAARGTVDLPAATLARTIWQETAQASRLMSLELPAGDLPAWRVIKERRATISQPAGSPLRVNPRPFENLALAGDWLSAMPATIESAVASGRRAAREMACDADLRRPWRLSRPANA